MTQLLKEFHDAELVAAVVDRYAGTVTLRFSLAHSLVTEIEMAGVSHFKISDFIMQNVVSNLLISSFKKLPHEEVERKVRWVTNLGDGEAFATDSEVLEITQRIIMRELVLFALDPSWGREVVAICKSCRVN